MALIHRKSLGLLWTAIGIDTALLFFFKYFYLIAESIGSVFGISYLANLEHNWIADYNFHIDLPIAISFYTFQIIAFVVDAYRGTVKDYVEPRKFIVFILFFPQFIAGPIMRASDFIPQIDRPWAEKDRILNGVLLLAMGVIKKVLMADRLGALTMDLWHNPDKYDGLVLLVGLPAFAAQVYLDFSGYTDMARGLALALGYDIPENFRGPFLAKSMQELWTRWHITLSTWLRDYIYIPLGGSRLGELRTAVNLLITMAVGGIWHGAKWTMLLWGLYLGVILVVERILRNRGFRILPQTAFFNYIRSLIILAVFSFSAIFFAAPDMDRTLAVIKGILVMQRGLPFSSADTVIGLTLLAYIFNLIQYYPALLKDRLNRIPTVRIALVPVTVFAVGYLVSMYGDISGMFIYFQF